MLRPSSTASPASGSPQPSSLNQYKQITDSLVPASVVIAALFIAFMGYGLWQAGLNLTDIAVYSPLIFALLSFGVYSTGFWLTRRTLAAYDQEFASLPNSAAALRNSADVAQPEGGAGMLLSEGGRREIKALREQIQREGALDANLSPLLRFRLEEVLGAITRGAPLLTGDGAYADEKHFPGPERLLRTMMDVVLNLGIAGTFCSLILTFSGSVSETGASGVGVTLLSHLGPGLVSGMAAVVANIALRLCHTSLIAKQDALSHEVQTCIDDNLLLYLPRGLTSPDDRLAEAVACQIKAQNETVAKHMAEQIQGIGDALQANSSHMADMFALKLEPSIKLIATETEYLARSADTLAIVSRSWEASDTLLRKAHAQFLDDHKEALAVSEKRVSDLFMANKDAQAQFLFSVEAYQSKLAERTEEHFQAYEKRQAYRLEKLVEAAANKTGAAAAEHVAQIETLVSDALGRLQNDLSISLPAAIGEQVGGALTQTVSEVSELQKQVMVMAEMTHALQVENDKAVDRQEKTRKLSDERYSDFAKRIEAAQNQFVAMLETNQRLQENSLTAWQQAAEGSLSQIETACTLAAESVKGGVSTLDESLKVLGRTVDGVTGPLDGLARRVRGFQQAIDVLEGSLKSLQALQGSVATHLGGFGDDADGLRTALHTATGRLNHLNDSLIGAAGVPASGRFTFASGQETSVVPQGSSANTALTEASSVSAVSLDIPLEVTALETAQ